MYWPYQKPKKCWKCGGIKVWIPQYNKWTCPQCEKPTQTQMYPPYPYPPYRQPGYGRPPYLPPQSGYAQYQQPIYRGPPSTTYQSSQIYQDIIVAGNKRCIYCGATMKEDEEICPKCMQRALVL